MTFRGEELPLRTALARLAVLDAYAERDELGELERAGSAEFNPDRRVAARGARAARRRCHRRCPIRSCGTKRRRRSRCYELERALVAAADATTDAYRPAARHVVREAARPGPRGAADECARPLSAPAVAARVDVHEGSARSTSVLATTLALGFDMTAIPNIRLDLEDRPQKSPRACVIPSNPPEVVHLITRAQGGLSDYQAFMHEAGHALHYAGVDPRLPYTFRSISRDHALTEIYSYIFEAVTREPGWHALHFGLSDAQAEENAQATLFLESLLYRRYTAKLNYELGFWSSFAEERGHSPRNYAQALTDATGIRYDERGYPADMDAGFYSADYLRAWIRSAQLRVVSPARGRRRLVAERSDGRDPARALPRGEARADERRGGRPDRLRAARHPAARRGSQRGALSSTRILAPVNANLGRHACVLLRDGDLVRLDQLDDALAVRSASSSSVVALVDTGRRAPCRALPDASARAGVGRAYAGWIEKIRMSEMKQQHRSDERAPHDEDDPERNDDGLADDVCGVPKNAASSRRCGRTESSQQRLKLVAKLRLQEAGRTVSRRRHAARNRSRSPTSSRRDHSSTASSSGPGISGASPDCGEAAEPARQPARRGRGGARRGRFSSCASVSPKAQPPSASRRTT